MTAHGNRICAVFLVLIKRRWAGFMSEQHRQIDYGLIAGLVSLWLVIAGLIMLDTGAHGVSLLGLGTLLGGVFLYAQYGFASVWRNALETGNLMGLSAHFWLAGLCAIVFLGASVFGLSFGGITAQPTLAPVSVSLFIGAFLFGIGMQLANGCGSGVLFTFGGGSGRMIFALPAFVVGSLLGSFLVPSAIGWGSWGQVAIGGNLGDTGRWLVNLALLFGVSLALFIFARRRGERLDKRIFIASLVIALLCWLVFLLSGHPWGVTFGYTLWGAKLAEMVGVPVSSFAFWQWAGPEQALRHSVLANTSSVMNIGMLVGAAILACLDNAHRHQSFPPKKQIIAAIIGGLIMGIGARLSYGCNIGAFLAGTASGSLHGWLWFVMAFAGSAVGISLRPKFGFLSARG